MNNNIDLIRLLNNNVIEKLYKIVYCKSDCQDLVKTLDKVLSERGLVALFNDNGEYVKTIKTI